MRHFEGMVLQNLEIKKNNHSENGERYFEEIRRSRLNLILQVGVFRLQTDRPGLSVSEKWKTPFVSESRETLI